MACMWQTCGIIWKHGGMTWYVQDEIAITSRKLENGDGMTTFVADIYIYIYIYIYIICTEKLDFISFFVL
jgi:hypothetical protein